MLLITWQPPACRSTGSSTDTPWVTSLVCTGRRSSTVRSAAWIRPPSSLRFLCSDSITVTHQTRLSSAQHPSAPGPNPGSGRERLHRRQPPAHAAGAPRGRLWDRDAASRLAARRLAAQSRPGHRPVDRLEPRCAARGREAANIFDCIAYGAYSFETDRELIYRTNFNLISRLLAGSIRGGFPAMCTPAAPPNMATIPPGPGRTIPGTQQPLLRLQGRCRQPD